MNYIDAILVAVMALAVWAGWQKGFIMGSVNLLVWLGSLAAGFFFYAPVGAWLGRIFPSVGVWSLPLAFILVVILARILLALLSNLMLRRTPEQLHHGKANHWLGLIPGAVNALIYATIAAAVLIGLPLRDRNFVSSMQQSRLANRLAVNAGWIDEKLSPIFHDAVSRSLTGVVNEPETDETVPLNFTITNAKPRADLEAEMLQLVNAERTKRGLAALAADTALVPVARAHAQDMFARGYFSHYTPEHKDPFDRMHAAGIKYMAAGENLALGQTLKICHEGLMNSPGHRANILNPAYGRLGIGILDGGAYGLMIVQEFRN